MKGAFILTIVFSLLIVGFLVIRNMDSHTAVSETSGIEEIEKAHEAAAQANKSLEEIRKSVSLGESPTLP